MMSGVLMVILMLLRCSDLSLWKISCDTRLGDVVTISFIGGVSGGNVPLKQMKAPHRWKRSKEQLRANRVSFAQS